jgi:UDP-glucose 4-epimerase
MPDHPTPRTLVIGGGGLLGSAVVRELARRGRPSAVAQVDWDGDSVADLTAALDDFAGPGPWRIAWCAGAGVTATAAERFAREEVAFDAFCAALTAHCRDGSLRPTDGAVFLASSAGALYAGIAGAPFTETSPTRPLGAYGLSKQALEARLTQLSEDAAVATIAGRITNLYGPGQNLDKPQGLVSHLCRVHVTGAPLGIYVPLDTLRDYLFVEDAAGLVLDVLERAAVEPGRPRVKIIASHASVSVGALLMQAQRVFRRPIRVLHGASSQAAQQARDLRVRSTVWPELDRRSLRTLPAGIAATAADVEARLTGRSR